MNAWTTQSRTIQANREGPDQTTPMHMLILVYAVRLWYKGSFRLLNNIFFYIRVPVEIRYNSSFSVISFDR